MRVVLIDDEPLILAHFEKILSKIDEIDIVGTFINPYEALDNIHQSRPDIVFLDIEMPEINGLELAETIQSRWPFIKIVFATAHSEYAVRAFDLNAVDYLLKPVQMDRLIKTIDRLRKDFGSSTPDIKNYETVCCFHSLQFKTSEVLNVRWRTSKAKELFAFLLQYRGKPVSKSMLLDLFWPETDWEKGFAHLYTTIYQIRKMLRSINFKIKITSSDNNYMLDLNGVKLDVENWEQQLNLLPSLMEDTLPKHQKILKLYRGDYLSKEGYSWAESERERLRALWLSHVANLTEFLVSIGEYPEAIANYLYVQEAFPFVEDHYFMLMKLYDKVGDRIGVESQYISLKKMCITEYGVEPRSDVQAWYQKWASVSPR